MSEVAEFNYNLNTRIYNVGVRRCIGLYDRLLVALVTESKTVQRCGQHADMTNDVVLSRFVCNIQPNYAMDSRRRSGLIRT